MNDKYLATDLSECCSAAMTYSDFDLVCKACFAVQESEFGFEIAVA